MIMKTNDSEIPMKIFHIIFKCNQYGFLSIKNLVKSTFKYHALKTQPAFYIFTQYGHEN